MPNDDARRGIGIGEFDNGVTLADVGELVLVERISLLCRSGPGSSALGADEVVGIGDDAAVLSISSGQIVAAADMAVAGRHFRTDWSEPEDIGAKVAAANLADIAAMGAQPTSLLISLGLPAETTLMWVERLMQGVIDEAARAQARVIGGDVVRADAIVISGMALGDGQGRPPVRRAGAQPGDVVAVAGILGWSAAGLAVLTRGFRSPRALVDAHRRPQPPYRAGIDAARHGAHAMIDISDGLLLDLSRVAHASEVIVNVDSALIAIAEPLAAAASAYNLDPLYWVLGGGEDHALVAFFAADQELPVDFTAIGTVSQLHDAGTGQLSVTVDGRPPQVESGFTHFS